MSRVFVCSPFRGDIRENKINARRICRELCQIGCTPIAPHLLFPQFLDDDDSRERDMGISCGIDILTACEKVYVYNDNGISAGMKVEIEMAEKLGLPIEYSAPVD